MPQKTTAYLTREEERKLIRAGQRGCVESRNRVIMNIYHLIERDVIKRLYMPDQIQDAINFAVSVLIEKFHKFELARNLRYSTYALYWVPSRSKDTLITGS